MQENESQGCTLASTLIRVFEGLSKHGTAHTMVNDWIDLPLAAYDPARRHPVGFHGEDLRPYHTLLLKDSEVTSSVPH